MSPNALANLFCLLTLTVTLKIAFCSFQAALIFHPKRWRERQTKKLNNFRGILEQVAANTCSQLCPPEWPLSGAGTGSPRPGTGPKTECCDPRRQVISSEQNRVFNTRWTSKRKPCNESRSAAVHWCRMFHLHIAN